MVERLKHAIEKARTQRGDAASDNARAPAGQVASAKASASPTPSTVDQLWTALEPLELDPGQLVMSRIVTHDKSHPAHISFDLLRTRILKVFKDNGWRSVAITSPTKGCGKTLVAANLAFSLARQADIRTAVIDMDLKVPGLTKALRSRADKQIAWFLKGRSPVESAFQRIGTNLAVALNSERVQDSTEVIQDERTEQALASMMARLEPDVVIYDLPPLLVSDDALAFLPHADCVLLVAASGQTTAQQIEECERQFTGETEFLGVLLNKAEDLGSVDKYDYY